MGQEHSAAARTKTASVPSAFSGRKEEEGERFHLYNLDDEDQDGEIRDMDNNSDGDQHKKDKSKNKFKHDKIEVNFDDIVDDDDQECLLDY